MQQLFRYQLNFILSFIIFFFFSGSQEFPHTDKGQHTEPSLEWSIWGIVTVNVYPDSWLLKVIAPRFVQMPVVDLWIPLYYS